MKSAAEQTMAWLDARAEPMPPALRARLAEMIGGLVPVTPARAVHETLLVAGEALLARLLNHNRTTREGALDLLAADALITYAFEAAAEEGVAIGDRARRAIVQIATLGG
ncbi:MAG: hypothetical protein SFW08_10385 [Gemmatimonadaceae bacterium]|nr:hypothetical protein [Gemmatimonadaceae bacterium]